MTGRRITLDELFEEQAARNLAQSIADDNDPVVIARRKEMIQQEIRMGYRDANGDWNLSDDFSTACEECGENIPRGCENDFDGTTLCDACFDDINEMEEDD